MNSRTWRWRGVKSVIGRRYHDRVFGANTRSEFLLRPLDPERAFVRRCEHPFGGRRSSVGLASDDCHTPVVRSRYGPNVRTADHTECRPHAVPTTRSADQEQRPVSRAGVITITTRATARQRPTTLPCRPAVATGAAPVVSRATYWRRRIVVGVLAVVLVLVMAQAGAALGGSPSPPPSAAQPPRRNRPARPAPARSCARATRCGRWPPASRPATTPARSSTRWRPPGTAPSWCRGRPSSGTAEPRPAPRRPRRPRYPPRRAAGPPWLRPPRR